MSLTKQYWEMSPAKRAWGQAWKPFKNFLLSKWISPPIVGALYALALGVSMVMDFGVYFLILGISPSEVPLTIADIIRSSVTWFPLILIATTGAVSISWILALAWAKASRMDAWKYICKIDNNTNKFWAVVKKIFVAPLAALGAAIAYTLISNTCMSLIIYWTSWNSFLSFGWVISPDYIQTSGLITLCFAVAFTCVLYKRIDSARISIVTERISRLIFTILALFFVVFASFMIKFDQSKLVTKDCNNQPILIRSLEKYILINRCGKLEFLNTDRVDHIKINKGGPITVILK